MSDRDDTRDITVTIDRDTMEQIAVAIDTRIGSLSEAQRRTRSTSDYYRHIVHKLREAQATIQEPFYK